jgi:excisionase family DNA binding protein
MKAEKINSKREPTLKPNERLWNMEEAMEYLGVSRSAFYRLMAIENLPSLKVGGKLRFIPEQLQAWAKKKSAS